MTGYDEAVAWFDSDPEAGDLPMSATDQRHAATIVRAALARDIPAGRDLTAQDVDDALHIDCPTNEQIAERLNRIARPSGGDGPRSWSLPAPPPDDVTVVHVQAGDELLRCVREGYHWRDESGGSLYRFGELLDLGDVVEGEPPAPQPQEPRFGPEDNSLREFERGFYRLARDLKFGTRVVGRADTEIAIVDVEGPTEGYPGGWVVMRRNGDKWVVTDAALAAAGAVRVEEEQA